MLSTTRSGSAAPGPCTRAAGFDARLIKSPGRSSGSVAAVCLLAARHCRGCRRAVAAENARIHDSDATLLDHRDGFLQGLLQLGRIPAWAEPGRALAASDRGH